MHDCQSIIFFTFIRALRLKRASFEGRHAWSGTKGSSERTRSLELWADKEQAPLSLFCSCLSFKRVKMHVSSRTKAAYVRAVEHALGLWSSAPACRAELTPRKPNFHFHILVWIRYRYSKSMQHYNAFVTLWRNACEPLKSNCWVAKRPRLFARLSKIN